MERVNDEVATFCKSRKAEPPSSASKVDHVKCASFNNHHPYHSSSKSRSRIRISSYIYLPCLFLAAAVQYFGGMNELVVELMSYTYYNYGLLHGGEYVYTDTSYGRLKGFTSESREGRQFYQFLGIPYSKPPVGELRFQVIGFEHLFEWSQNYMLGFL